MHIGHCADCREFFARDAALVRAVSTYGAGARAPESLRKRIHEAIIPPPRTLTAPARRAFSSIGEFPSPTE